LITSIRQQNNNHSKSPPRLKNKKKIGGLSGAWLKEKPDQLEDLIQIRLLVELVVHTLLW
jgi:hypothetical protein